jgi:GMP synthase (glutamine-hydrolysing)
MDPRPLLVIQHAGDAGLGLLAGPLTRALTLTPAQGGVHGGGIRVVRPDLGEVQPETGDLGGFGGLVVLGGAMAAWEDDVAPWLPATRALLAEAVRRGTPTLGICLGAQLLAAACGGQVERGSAGLEIGLTSVRALPAADGDPFVRALAAGPQWPVVQYHYDAVTRLPGESELLVTGDRYPYQGFRVGASAWGVQYHPEVSPAGFADWVEDGRADGSLPADAEHLLRPVRDGAVAQTRLGYAHARALLAVMKPRSPGDDGPADH